MKSGGLTALRVVADELGGERPLTRQNQVASDGEMSCIWFVWIFICGVITHTDLMSDGAGRRSVPDIVLPPSTCLQIRGYVMLRTLVRSDRTPCLHNKNTPSSGVIRH